MNSTLFRIAKNSSEKIVASNLKLDNYSLEKAIANGEVVTLTDNQTFHKIKDFYEKEENKASAPENMFTEIVNVVVPHGGNKKKQVADAYGELAKTGFSINGIHYKRLCSGSGQIRRNTITFAKDSLHDYLFKSLCCGLLPEDFGDDFNTAKFNAYFGLNMSGVRFVCSPRVCVVDDYQQIKPHLKVDYIETHITETERNKRKIKVIEKKAEHQYYDDASKHDLPCLNSFDGQGLCDPEYAERIALELGYLSSDGSGYMPSQYILRAPWIKGLVAVFRWKDYCREHNVTELKDIFGTIHNIDNIDILLSKSQFKMWKIFAKTGGWDYYLKSMEANNLRWGIVRPDTFPIGDYRALSYQYINALLLDNQKIETLCKRSKTFLTKLCSGDLKTVTRTLLKNNVSYVDAGEEDGTETLTTSPRITLISKALSHNPELINDTFIREQIYQECKSKFLNAKVGRIEVEGNYQFILSDPVAQIQHVIKTHAVNCETNIEVKGLLNAGEVYSDYWISKKAQTIVLMRSPMIDQSEVAVRNVSTSQEMENWYDTLKSGIVLPIHDLTALQMQGCDFDGDTCFSSSDEILIQSAIPNPVPIKYPTPDTQQTGEVTDVNLIEADKRGLNSAVGSISNKSCCFYARLAEYAPGTEEHTELLNRIKILGESVGVEIDKIKTGIPPLMPSNWRYITLPKSQDEDGKFVFDCSDEEKEGFIQHNRLVPYEKPYFMRYRYDDIDATIRTYNEAFRKEASYQHGLALDKMLITKKELLSISQNDMVDRYNKYFPLNDSHCAMNEICHIFEQLEGSLHTPKGTTNMLKSYSPNQPIDETTLSLIGGIVAAYKRNSKIISKLCRTESDSTVEDSAKVVYERLKILREYSKGIIFAHCNDNIRFAFECLVELMRQGKCTEDNIWDIMDDSIFEALPKNRK